MISDNQSKELFYIPKTINKQTISINKKTDINLKYDDLNTLVVTSVAEPQITLKVFTDLNTDIEKLAAIKIESTRNLDISIKHKRGQKTETSHLNVVLSLPYTFSGNLELEGKTHIVTIYHCMHPHTEVSGKLDKVVLFDLRGQLELDSNSRLELTYDGSLDKLDINQVNSSTNLLLARGSDTYIYSASNTCDVVLVGCVINPNSRHQIEFNGKTSHLIARNE